MKNKKDIRVGMKDFKKKILDPVITWIWERCFVIKKICLKTYRSGRAVMRNISGRTAPVKIPEFVLKDKGKIIEVNFRRAV